MGKSELIFTKHTQVKLIVCLSIKTAVYK